MVPVLNLGTGASTVSYSLKYYHLPYRVGEVSSTWYFQDGYVQLNTSVLQCGIEARLKTVEIILQTISSSETAKHGNGYLYTSHHGN